MSTVSGRWRRIALRVVGHASWVLPGARSDWADAMCRELDYIEDDRAALHWAIGCVTASYAARFAALLRPRWRISSAAVVAGSMLLLIAMALQGHASDEASLASDRISRCRSQHQTSQPSQSQNRSGSHRQSEADAGCAECRSKSTDALRLKNADTPSVAWQCPP